MGASLENGEKKVVSLTDIFNEQFPYYLIMGMSSEEFWHGRFDLVIGYRKAYELKKEIKDNELWRQGLYFYEALLDASPILQAFAKKGTKPRPYPEKPYGVKDKEEKTEEEKQKDVEKERLRARLHFMNLTRALQKQFGGTEENGTR